MIFYGLLRFGLLFVFGLSKEDNIIFFLFVHSWLHSFRVNLKCWDPVNQFNNTTWVAVGTPTDNPMSVRNVV